MNLSTQIAWDDTILPFQLDRSDTRGRIVRLDSVLDQILSQHDYPPKVEALVAEMALLTALIGQAIKLKWKLSLQVRGDGPVRLIATDYFAPTDAGEPAKIRAYANFDGQADLSAPAFDLVGGGHFGILIDQGPGNVPYQGITPVTGPTLAACAETYFAQSEQLPTRFALRFGKSTLAGKDERWRAGGVMLQQMPKASTPMEDGPSQESGLLAASDLLDDEDGEAWNRVNLHLDTVEDLELIGPSVQSTTLLTRLFHEEFPRVFDAQPVRFGCTCSPDRVRDSLAPCTPDEIAEMITDTGVVTADCQFCGAYYQFDPDTLGANGISDA